MAADAALASRFREFVAADPIDLFEGALLVSVLIDPTEDLDAARRAVAELAGRVRSAGGARLDALRRVLFEEEDFRGDADSYDEPSNSSVARVLARRRGMPITLSIVTLEVGRLAGMRLTGVGLPGHFVVGGPELGGRYLDPFDGGVVVEPEQISQRLASIFGGPVALSDEHMRPDPPRAILARVLLNLRRSWERRHRWEEALAALELSGELEPESESLERERGLLLLKCGRNAEAIAALESYAAMAADEDARPVLRLIEALREGPASVQRTPPKVFTLEQARALLPKVKELTADAAERYGRLPGALEEERHALVEEWARELTALGLEIKGLWLVDFDSGAGYYCWKYPEPALDHFHGYDEGYAARIPLA